MRGIFLIVLGLVLLLVVAGCSRKAAPSTSVEITDSTITKEVPRIIEVHVPGDTVIIQEYIECDSLTNKPKPKKLSASHARAFVSVSIDSTGMLEASGGCDSLRKEIEVMDKEIFRLRHEKKTITAVEYKTRGIDIFCRWFTGIAIVLLIIYVILKIK